MERPSRSDSRQSGKGSVSIRRKCGTIHLRITDGGAHQTALRNSSPMPYAARRLWTWRPSRPEFTTWSIPPRRARQSICPCRPGSTPQLPGCQCRSFGHPRRPGNDPRRAPDPPAPLPATPGPVPGRLRRPQHHRHSRRTHKMTSSAFKPAYPDAWSCAATPADITKLSHSGAHPSRNSISRVCKANHLPSDTAFSRSTLRRLPPDPWTKAERAL